jgi:transcriptional regulator with XRE-family HTH domain
MIYIYQVLKQIRIMRQYNANAIAKNLGLQVKAFSEYESKLKLIPTDLMTRWLTELDISDADHHWYQQKHKREYVTHLLSQHLHSPTPQGKELIARVADILVFADKIDISAITVQLQKHVMSHIAYRPRSAEVAIDILKDEDV